LLWAVPASLILHALITAFLAYGLPTPPQQPQEEQPVNVALVPPPEPPKKPEAKKPPEPKSEKPPEQKVEKPAPQTLPPLPVLKPVFQFGDKDAGPRKSLDGGSAQDDAPSPGKADESKPPAVPKDAEIKPAPPDSGKPVDSIKAGEKPVTAAKDTEPAQEKPATQDMSNQEAGTPDADTQASATAMPLTASGDDGEIELPASAQVPQTRPEKVPKPRPSKAAKSGRGITGEPGSTEAAAATSRAYSGLPGVRKLFSRGVTGDAFATTAMDSMPRNKRGTKLCASALDRELTEGSYFPQVIPSPPLKVGNVLDAPDVAFRTATTWYHLSFRCEVDTNATQVLSFDFRVGPAVTPEESAQLEQAVRRQHSGG
jgi:hypothetical protein